MKPIGLIIEDNAEIRDALADRLESLGHDFDAVGSQLEARDRLKRCTFDYILLDLELPFRIGRPPSIPCGKNILCEIRADPKHAHVPVIVVTAHGHDSPDLAVELMKLGATDFGIKPFHNLDEKIREAIGRKQAARPQVNGQLPSAPEPEQLEGAELTFFEGRAELAGVEVCKADNGVIWRILKFLNQTRPDGRPRGFPGQKIADDLNLERGQNGVADAISHFRNRTIEALKEAGFVADRETVIMTGKAGYQLNPALTVRDRQAVRGTQIVDDEGLSGEERRAWILDQLGEGRKLRRVDIEKHFDRSKATVKRDLGALDDRIQFVGSGPTGFYTLSKIRTAKLLSRTGTTTEA